MCGITHVPVCPSVPIWQRAAAPLPVVRGGCLSKAFPSPPRSSWRFSGTDGKDALRSSTHAAPRLAGAAGRESRAGRQGRAGREEQAGKRGEEPRQPHAKRTDSGLNFRAQTSSKLTAFWSKAAAAPRTRGFPRQLLARRMPPELAHAPTSSRWLNGFHLLPSRLILARGRTANCSPAARPAAALLGRL